MPAPNENYGSGGSDSIQFGEGWHPLLLELRFVPIGIGDNDLPGGHTSHMLGDRRQKIGQRPGLGEIDTRRSEEHTSELQSLMRISYAVFCLKKKKTKSTNDKCKERQYIQTIK